MQLPLDILGLKVRLESSHAALLSDVARDFAAFASPDSLAEPALRLEARLQSPDYASLPDLPATFVTPRNVVYNAGRLRYVDYFGRGLLQGDQSTYRLESSDPDLLREMIYLLLLSQSGQHFDRRGLHRLHALGVRYRGRAVLLLLPSGGGKSSLALRILKRPGFELISEDSPLVDRRGRIHPFHTCLGMKASSPPADIPAQYLRQVRRMEFDPKILIDLDYFRQRCCWEPVEPWLLLVGRRRLGTGTYLRPLSRRASWRALVTNLVVGIGLYQGLEFLLERQTSEVFSRFGLIASRAFNALQLLRRSQGWSFEMGRDIDQNLTALESFLKA